MIRFWFLYYHIITDTFLNGLIQMSNMLQNIIEIVNEKSPYCGHLETVKDVQQLLSKISQCIDE